MVLAEEPLKRATKGSNYMRQIGSLDLDSDDLALDDRLECRLHDMKQQEGKMQLWDVYVKREETAQRSITTAKMSSTVYVILRGFVLHDWSVNMCR